MTFATNVKSEFSSLPGGSLKWVQKTISFPEGCEYVSHELEVIEKLPSQTGEKWPESVLKDLLQRDSAGKVSHLEITVGAYRPVTAGMGSATTLIRVAVTATCSETSLLQFSSQFEA